MIVAVIGKNHAERRGFFVGTQKKENKNGRDLQYL